MNLKAAASIEDGLLLAGQFRPEVILLDYFFSEDLLTGHEGLAFIRHAKLIQKVKVIAMMNDRRMAARMLKGGADAILLKPFDLTEFRSAIYTQWKGRREAGKRAAVSGVQPSSKG
jgi:DNA-binding NarL/FixJ family response regulator